MTEPNHDGEPAVARRLLVQFGISLETERVWQFLISNPDASTVELGVAAGVAVDSVTTALEELAESRFIHRASSKSGYAAYEPTAAIQAHVADAQRDLAEQSANFAALQTLLPEIGEAYVHGRLRSGVDRGLEVVTSLDEVRENLVVFATQAREEIRAFIKHATADAVRDGRRRDPGLYRRGLTQRTIFDQGQLTDLDFYDEFAKNSAAGDQIRSMVNAPTQLLIYDRDVAVHPIDIARPRLGAIFIRERAVIDTLIHMFEHHWREATPVYLETPTEGLVTERQTRIVESLANGATDEAIARALGVGVRTIRREVADIRDLLGVRSRTEIVSGAIRRGWL